MERQRAEARKAWAGSGEAATETVWFALRERLGATEFLGYETETAEGVVDGAGRATASRSARWRGRDAARSILNQTPFYGESGGQVGDIGAMIAPGLRLDVLDTKKKLGDLFVHEVEVEEGTLQVGAALALRVDHDARSAIRANHSATHLLHEALRAGARRPRRAEGLARLARPPALRLRPPQADHATPSSPRSRTSPIASCCKTRRS